VARKVDEAANFVFVQLIKKEPGIYDKRHPDYARGDKIDLAWEIISRDEGVFVTERMHPIFLFLILYLSILLY
jgi:hypothetical protein